MSLNGENNVINKCSLLLVSVMLTFCSGMTQAPEINPYVMLEDVATKTFSSIKQERQLIEAEPELMRMVM